MSVDNRLGRGIEHAWARWTHGAPPGASAPTTASRRAGMQHSPT